MTTLDDAYKTIHSRYSEGLFTVIDDRRILFALAQIESSWNPRARSEDSTAVGLFQITRAAFDDVQSVYPNDALWSAYDGRDDKTMVDPAYNAEIAMLYISLIETRLKTQRKDVVPYDVITAYNVGVAGFLRGDTNSSYAARVLWTASQISWMNDLTRCPILEVKNE